MAERKAPTPPPRDQVKPEPPPPPPRMVLWDREDPRWLPIDTAPQDGSVIFVLWGSRPDGDLGLAYWKDGKWWTPHGGMTLFNVTHWLPSHPRPYRTIPPIIGTESNRRHRG